MLRIRFICTSYWLLLTMLLLVPDPLALFGIRRIPGASTGLGPHFLAFAALGVLVLASRLPLQRALLAGLLVGYAAATELLQLLFPPRTPQLRDFLENLLGLAAGATICWVAQKRGFQKQKAQE
jgi:hypothetical protein